MLLEVADLRVAYDHNEVIKGISFTVAKGEVVAIIGSNGAGKSTTLRTISGLVRPRSGRIRWKGVDIAETAAERIVARGLAHCPEGRRVFPALTVLENLRAGASARKHNRAELSEDLETVLSLFPRLRERAKQGAWSLSGGEQQMLAIGRALMSRPELLMLDEPSLGLAPIIIEQVFDRIKELNERRGLSILLVEQNSAMALDVAHRALVLDTGAIALAGDAKAVAGDPRVREAYLGG